MGLVCKALGDDKGVTVNMSFGSIGVHVLKVAGQVGDRSALTT